MSKKLKIKFVKFEKALAMQVLEQEGSFRNSEHVRTGIPDLCSGVIYLCDDEKCGNLELSTRYFITNDERDEYLKNFVRWISEEQFGGSTRELKIGEWCAACMAYGWRKRKLVAILPERYKNRFIVNVANDDRNWMSCDEVRPLMDCIEPIIDGDVYTWEM